MTGPARHPGVRLAARLLRDWFLIGMAAAVVLAGLFPEVGRTGGPLRPELLAPVGIFLVFLLHGLGLAPEKLLAGLSRWRLHLLVQVFTFGVFPALFLLFDLVAGERVAPELRLGFLFLCALPSTISSSVAMTGIAGGNVAGAVFNASLSSVLGVVLTPALLELLARTPVAALSLPEAIGKLGAMVILPMLLGQLLRPVLGGRAARLKAATNGADRLVILLLVYASFSDSVASGIFQQHPAGIFVVAVLGVALLLAIVLSLSTFAARALGFEKEDEIAAVFCGSKKTLASGIPIARVLFGAHPGLGLIVLPLMFYHQLQLVAGAVLAERYAARRR